VFHWNIQTSTSVADKLTPPQRIASVFRIPCVLYLEFSANWYRACIGRLFKNNKCRSIGAEFVQGQPQCL